MHLFYTSDFMPQASSRRRVDYADWLTFQRKEKDRAFARDAQSPIEDKRSFKGLAYFPPDEKYRVVARWLPTASARRLVIPTSTGEERAYEEAGRLSFELDGKKLTLTAFDDGFGGELFVPTRDHTSGAQTYGAGRYLQVERPEGDEVIVDFNLAYHPFCAYSDAYSCPLPPRENWLDIAVLAGEKNGA